MMSKNTVLVSVATLALIGGVVWHLLDSQRGQQSHPLTTTDTSSSNPSGLSDGSSGAVSAAIPGRVGSRAPLDGIRSYGELARRLASEKVEEAQRLQFMLTATQVCEGYRLAQGTSSAPNQGHSKSMDYYNGFASRFCSDFSGSSNQLEATLLAHSDSDVVKARELVGMAAEGLSRETTLVGETIVLTSRNPDAIYNAAAALASQKDWQLGRDVAKTPQERAALQQAQWMAAQMVACDLSGGCGANGLTTLIECGSYNNCTPGITVRDVMRQTSTPVQFELANRIYQQLLRDREAVSALSS